MYSDIGFSEIYQTWPELKAKIMRNPRLLWAKDYFDRNLAHHCAGNYGVNEIKELLELVQQQSTSEEDFARKKKKLFENDECGTHPLHDAIVNGMGVFALMIEQCCPSGMAFLDKQDDIGWNFAHHAVFEDDVDILEYVLLHAPKGLALLNERDFNDRVPFDLNGPLFTDHFNEQKLREIGLKRELQLIESSISDGDSLGSLMQHVLRQQTEVLLYQNRGVEP